MNWYKQSKHVDEIPGGFADKKKPKDYSADQLAKGIKVEMEHTNDPEKAKEIAMDHLEEFPTYYTALDEMEKKLKKQKTAGMANWKEYPKSMRDKLSEMFGIDDDGELKTFPAKKKKNKGDGECAHSLDMHCDGGDDGW